MSPKLSSLSMFFPCFNEAENLKILIPKAHAAAKEFSHKFELLVIDDGSTDDTKAVVATLQLEYPELHIISHSTNRGYGGALRTGIESSGMDWIFWTDADLQFDFDSLASFLPHTEKYDAVLGYRKHRADTFIRKVNGELYTQLIRFLFHVRIRDVDCAFKLIKRSSLNEMKLTTSSAFTSAEIIIYLSRHHIAYKEVPVSHFPRRLGKPTGGNMRVIFRGIKDTLSFYLCT